MVQVLLVAGGTTGAGGSAVGGLSSTEVLTGDSPAWTMATPLPRAVDGMRGISLDNTVYMTGKVYYTILYYIVLYCTALYYIVMYFLVLKTCEHISYCLSVSCDNKKYIFKEVVATDCYTTYNITKNKRG